MCFRGKKTEQCFLVRSICFLEKDSRVRLEEINSFHCIIIHKQGSAVQMLKPEVHKMLQDVIL